MSDGIQYDEAWGQRLVQIYSTPDVAKQRQIVLSSLDLQPDERVLDIGSGPGLLIEDMARIIGTGGSISGVDVSDAMVALSKKRCAHLTQVELRVGDAAVLPFKDNEFDVAVSTQVYEYVQEIQKCLQELFRVLKPGGRALILCTDWDTMIWNTVDRERMKRILTIFEGHCADPRLARHIAPKLRSAGFELTNYKVYTILNPEYSENTYSHGVIDFIASYVSGKDGITAAETQSWTSELRERALKNEYFFSISRYMFVVGKPRM